MRIYKSFGVPGNSLKRYAGIMAISAALILSFADFILEFNKEYGVSNTIVEKAWASMPEWRFSLSMNLCMFFIPFYIPGFWLLYKALSKKSKKTAIAVCLIFTYGVIMGSPFIHGIMTLNGIIYKFGMVNGLSHELLTDLIAVKITGSILPVFLVHYLITWVIAPTILFFHILRGKSIFKRWTAFLNPLVFLLVGLAGLRLFPQVFVYLTPGAINKGNAAMFTLVTVYMWNDTTQKKNEH